MIILIGASSGIGSLIVEKLLKTDDIIATYNKGKILDKKTFKHKLIKVKLDITSESQIINFVKKYKKIFNKITLINLSTIKLDQLILNINQRDLIKAFEVNVFSNFYLAKYFIPIMIKENYGRFIFISSSKAEMGDVGISTYSSSKYSLHGLSKSISKEYANFGITSNILSLGYFETKLWKKLRAEKKTQLIDEIPSKNLGNSTNISNIILSVIKSEFINSSVIKIDGGI